MEHLSRCSLAPAFFFGGENAMDSITRGKPRESLNGEGPKQQMQSRTPPVAPQLPMDPRMVILFGMLLGAVGGVTLAQVVWKLAGLTVGAVAIAVPVGAIGGAVGGGLVGRITSPHLLVLVMALLVGWSVGALSGGLAWAETGKLAGGFLGMLVGGLTWTVWRLQERKHAKP
jgi:hypothetical protein